MRELLLAEARWWADQPEHAASARKWVTFFEQLPADEPLLSAMADRYPDADAYRNRAQDLGINRFSVWNMTCRLFEKTAQNRGLPPRPDLQSD